MNKKEKIDVIVSERSELRKEIIEYQSAIYRAILLAVSLAATAITVEFAEGLVVIDNARIVVVLVSSQLTFFLIYFVAVLLAGQSITAGYIAALEEKITELAEEPLSTWESEVTLATFVGFRSPYFWSIAAIGTLVVAALAGILWVAMRAGLGRSYIVLVVVEFVAAVFLLRFSYGAKSKGLREARSTFKRRPSLTKN